MYEPERYWDRVAREVERRGRSDIAGDDDPYYRYKRRKFVRRFIETLDLKGKSVLEIGCGPGGNLAVLASKNVCSHIIGVDISPVMCQMARNHLKGPAISLLRIDGAELPFRNRSIDTIFTVTVLQHTTREATLRRLVSEMCRVASSRVIVIEDIRDAEDLYGDVSAIGRPVDAYRALFDESGFMLADVDFLNTRVSRAWHHASTRVRRRLVRKPRHEGERTGFLFRSIVSAPMILTSRLDDVFGEDQDLARMIFCRARPAGDQ